MTVHSPAGDAARRTAWLQLHFCVLLWGFTAILGKLISLPALPLVWWRMLLVAAVLLVLPRVLRGIGRMSPRLRWSYAGVGALVALHWLTFYAAIKLSNASVAATCIALGTVFTAFVEPWLTGKRLSKREVALGIAVLPGVALVAGGVPDGMLLGIVAGTVSALFVALFGSLNKRLVAHADPLSVTALEMAAGVATLTLVAPLSGLLVPAFGGNPFALPSAHDAFYLVLLAMACTLVPFVLALLALRHLSAFATQLSVNLEPVYTIVLAALLLGEQRELTPRFYLGVAIILAAVLIFPLLTRAPRGARAEGDARDPDHSPSAPSDAS
ncbi:MAG: DMT family transporter [Xanthomonadaceae bacterium]|nr:DMT family transporter [Xanthomonadaceae bacterium]